MKYPLPAAVVQDIPLWKYMFQLPCTEQGNGYTCIAVGGYVSPVLVGTLVGVFVGDSVLCTVGNTVGLVVGISVDGLTLGLVVKGDMLGDADGYCVGGAGGIDGARLGTIVMGWKLGSTVLSTREGVAVGDRSVEGPEDGDAEGLSVPLK